MMTAIIALAACIGGLVAGVVAMVAYDAHERTQDLRAQDAARASVDRVWAERDAANAEAWSRWVARHGGAQ